MPQTLKQVDKKIYAMAEELKETFRETKAEITSTNKKITNV